LGGHKASCLIAGHPGGQRMALGHCARADADEADEADGCTYPFHAIHDHLH
jgi:hypothetical protein